MRDRRPCQCKQLSLYLFEISQLNEIRAFQLVPSVPTWVRHFFPTKLD